MGFGAVEGGEERMDCLFICLLGDGETRLVYAVINIIVGPLVGLFDVFAEALREEVYFCIFLGEDAIEFGIEHAYDLTRLPWSPYQPSKQ